MRHLPVLVHRGLVGKGMSINSHLRQITDLSIPNFKESNVVGFNCLGT